jgi:hypothetical protein
MAGRSESIVRSGELACFESTAPASPSSALRRKRHAARDSRLFRTDPLEPGHDAAHEETAVRRGNPYRAICTDYRLRRLAHQRERLLVVN